MSWPAAEIDVDEPLVRALLAEQHPDLLALPLSRAGAGWDNVLWRLGDDLLVRLPCRASSAPLIVNEQKWLSQLAGRLPLPVPTPVRIGRPSQQYPWAWSIVPWLDGAPGDLCPIEDVEDGAIRLGVFLRALHRPAPPHAPLNPFRGVPLADRQATFNDRVMELSGEIAAIRRAGSGGGPAPRRRGTVRRCGSTAISTRPTRWSRTAGWRP